MTNVNQDMCGHDAGLSPAANPAAAASLPDLTPSRHGERDSTPVPGSFGARLRAAREARGQDLDACASALHLPARVLRQLEADAYAGMDSHRRTRRTKGRPWPLVKMTFGRQRPHRASA